MFTRERVCNLMLLFLFLASIIILVPDYESGLDLLCFHSQLQKLEYCQARLQSIMNKRCEFCTLGLTDDRIIVWQDEEFKVIKDINPSSRTIHLLLMPKAHIESITTLNTIQDLSMLTRMREIAMELTNYTESGSKFVVGFHVPPFTSVDHLHLHLIQRPFKNFWRSIKYVEVGSGQWFKTIDTVIKEAEKNL